MLPEDTVTLLRERLAVAGLSPLAPALESLARPAIRLKTTRVQEDSIPLGASKVGGLPDLPSGAGWPWWKGLPLPFVAQVNLAEVTPFDVEQALPSSGLLLFFWTDMRWNDSEGKIDWVYGTDDPVQGRIIYYPTPLASLARSSIPANPAFAEMWAPCAVTYLPHLTLPSEQSTVSRYPESR